MPTLIRERVHGKTLDEARSAVELIAADVKESYPALVESVSWNKDQTEAKLKGKMFKGSIEVDDEIVRIELKLGLLAKPFMGKIEERIDAKIETYFGPDHA